MCRTCAYVRLYSVLCLDNCVPIIIDKFYRYFHALGIGSIGYMIIMLLATSGCRQENKKVLFSGLTVIFSLCYSACCDFSSLLCFFSLKSLGVLIKLRISKSSSDPQMGQGSRVKWNPRRESRQGRGQGGVQGSGMVISSPNPPVANTKFMPKGEPAQGEQVRTPSDKLSCQTNGKKK